MRVLHEYSYKTRILYLKANKNSLKALKLLDFFKFGVDFAYLHIYNNDIINIHFLGYLSVR